MKENGMRQITVRKLADSFIAKFRFDQESIEAMMPNSKILSEYYNEFISGREYGAARERAYTNPFPTDRSYEHHNDLFFDTHLPMVRMRSALEVLREWKVLERTDLLQERLKEGPLTLADGTVFTSHGRDTIGVKTALGQKFMVKKAYGVFSIPWGREGFSFEYQTHEERIDKSTEDMARQAYTNEPRKLERELQKLRDDRGKRTAKSEFEKIEDRFRQQEQQDNLEPLAFFTRLLDKVFSSGKDSSLVDAYVARATAHEKTLIGQFVRRIELPMRFGKILEAITKDPKLSQEELGRVYIKV